MDVEGIEAKFKEQEWYMPTVKRLIKEYQSIELDKNIQKIDDEPVRRLCQVLNDNDYLTIDSCDGHGKTKPMIFFLCDDQQHMRHLAYIINDNNPTNFWWTIGLYTENPNMIPDGPLMYVLKPEGTLENIKKSYDELKQDLDILGIMIMKYFDQRTAL